MHIYQVAHEHWPTIRPTIMLRLLPMFNLTLVRLTYSTFSIHISASLPPTILLHPWIPSLGPSIKFVLTHPSSTPPLSTHLPEERQQMFRHRQIVSQPYPRLATPSARIVKNEVGVDQVMVSFGVHIFRPITGYRGSGVQIPTPTLSSYSQPFLPPLNGHTHDTPTPTLTKIPGFKRSETSSLTFRGV